jgi:phage shock protein PspC (stress-responsive transcriptional regulator)
MNENPTLVDPLATGPEPAAGPTTGNTQSTTPPPPHLGYAPQRPPLRRSRADRVFGGVCGGIGRQYDIDATLLRILVVVITVFTGGGFAFAYLLGWIFIPDEPAWTPIPMPGAPGGTAYAAPQAGAVPTSYAAGGTGTYVDPATGQVYGAAQYYAPAKPREPRSYLGLITISVAVAVGGLLSLLAVAGVHMPAVAVAASMLAVVSIGLLVGAFRGRARWLIAPAVILLLVTQVAAAIPRAVNGSWGSGVGDRRWTPTVSSPAAFDLGAGDARLDLTRLPVGPATVSAHIGLGQLIVTVRPDTTVVLHATVGLGDIKLPGTPATSGASQTVDTTVPATTAVARSTVDLTVDIGLGELEVRRASS